MKTTFPSLILIFTLFLGCIQTDFDLQAPPDQIIPENADHDLVVIGIIDVFGREIHGTYFDEIGKLVRYIALDDEYLPSANKYRNHWGSVYRLGKNIRLIEEASENDESLVFHRGVARILWAFAFANIVDIHGDVPYFEALNPIDFPHPAISSGSEIYADLYKILDLAQEDFKRALVLKESDLLNEIPEAVDFIYQGKIESWMRLGNSLKLRLLVQTRLVNPEFSKEQINQLIQEDNLITKEEDFEYRFGNDFGEFPSGHSHFGNYYVGRPDEHIANYFIHKLKNSKTTEEEEPIIDPRIRHYLYRQTSENVIETDAIKYCWNPSNNPNLVEGFNYCFLGDSYIGRDHGYLKRIDSDFFEINTIPGVYPIGGSVDNNEGLENIHTSHENGRGINPLLLSSFVNFLKAEAALTLGTTGNPLEYLLQGVRESIDKTIDFAEIEEEFRVSESDIEQYIDFVRDAYNSAEDPSEKLQIIIEEYFLAAWGSPMEMYNAYRRTGFPSFPPPVATSVAGGTIGDFPRSMPWPRNVVRDNDSFNGKNKSETEQVFWDTNPEGFIK